MDILSTIILGIVEGLTEFLPVSSTGHLMLTAYLLKLPETEFLKSFEIIIQLGAILSVVVLYWRKLLVDKGTIKRVAVAFLPTALVGLTFYQLVKDYLLESEGLVLVALALGGLAIILFENWRKSKGEEGKSLEEMSLTSSALIGLFQSLALVPGVSRSAATIIGGLALGMRREAIVEFSFLLAVPTMLAASGLDLVRSGFSFSSSELFYLSLGFIVSFLVALLAIKTFLRFVQNRGLSVFGYYRIIVALIFFLIFF